MTSEVGAPVIETVCRAVTDWAHRRSDVHGLALVGSGARDAGRADSDIDLVLLVSDPRNFRSSSDWLEEIAWPVSVSKWTDASYGAVWSRHCELEDGTEVEVTFTSRDWASCSPIDPGTARVIRDGCRVLYDPLSLLGQLCDQVARDSAPG